MEFQFHTRFTLFWSFWIVSLLSSVSAIKKGDFFANETKSSPSHMTPTRGSSVWLTWGYDYGGDDPGSKEYIEQIIGFNSLSNAALQTVAKRIGPNSALQLEPSIPAPFTGRLQVIASNSTLVIIGLKYNDSAYQFASFVYMYVIIGASRIPARIDLKPVVRITVNGVPQFLVPPPASIEVNENSNLEVAIQMDGNPAASADFVWSHSGAAATTVAGSQIHPYVYSSKFTQRNMVASYCGRVLKTTAKNSIGSSLAKDTYVTVLLKLDADPKLQATKILIDNCVEVKWEKAESGSCYVKYEVKLKNASGSVVYTETGYNIDAMKKCKIAGNVNITDVEMTMSFKSTTKVFSSKVSETPIPTTLPPTNTSKTTKTKGSAREEVLETPIPTSLPPTTTPRTYKRECTKFFSKTPQMRILRRKRDMTVKSKPPDYVGKRGNDVANKSAIITALSVVVAVLLIALASMLIHLIRIRGRNGKLQAQVDGSKRSAESTERHYMDLQGQGTNADATYAGLQSQYEEIGNAAPKYENTKHL